MNTTNLLEQLAKEVHYNANVEKYLNLHMAIVKNDPALIRAQFSDALHLAHACHSSVGLGDTAN